MNPIRKSGLSSSQTETSANSSARPASPKPYISTISSNENPHWVPQGEASLGFHPTELPQQRDLSDFSPLKSKTSFVQNHKKTLFVASVTTGSIGVSSAVVVGLKISILLIAASIPVFGWILIGGVTVASMATLIAAKVFPKHKQLLENPTFHTRRGDSPLPSKAISIVPSHTPKLTITPSSSLPNIANELNASSLVDFTPPSSCIGTPVLYAPIMQQLSFSLETVLDVPESPLPIDIPLPESPLPVDIPLPESPLPIDIPLPESPLPVDIPLPESPLPVDIPLPESPLPVDIPLPESPLPVDIPLPESPLPVDIPLPESPFPVDILLPESPLPVDIPLPESPLPIDILLPESPLPVDIPLPESPLPVDIPLPESPLPVDIPLPESPLPVDIPLPESPIEQEILSSTTPQPSESLSSSSSFMMVDPPSQSRAVSQTTLTNDEYAYVHFGKMLLDRINTAKPNEFTILFDKDKSFPQISDEFSRILNTFSSFLKLNSPQQQAQDIEQDKGLSTPQESWLSLLTAATTSTINNVTNIIPNLNRFILENYNEANSQERSTYLAQRQLYLTAILCISWSLYTKACAQGDKVQRGSFKIEDPGQKLHTFLKNYVKFATRSETPESVVPYGMCLVQQPLQFSEGSMLSASQFAYTRSPQRLFPLSSHYAQFPDQFGIDLRFRGNEPAKNLFPNKGTHILFGDVSNDGKNLLFFKIEEEGLGHPVDSFFHAFSFLNSNHGLEGSRREKDNHLEPYYKNFCDSAALTYKKGKTVAQMYQHIMISVNPLESTSETQESVAAFFMAIAHKLKYTADTLDIRTGNEAILKFPYW